MLFLIRYLFLIAPMRVYLTLLAFLYLMFFMSDVSYCMMGSGGDGSYLDNEGLAFHRNEVTRAVRIHAAANTIISQNPGVDINITLSNGTQLSTQVLAQTPIRNILIEHCDDLREIQRSVSRLVLPTASPEYVPSAYPVSDFINLPLATARPTSPSNR